ncbi:hypothetical protein FHW67_003538 [Herbaspirillum sp. Sphag1AN]|uniref:DUF4148 domain-containing protein n=1 Tax=unclassified Herbaspirillum TaxID=2624150 RepID=UPI00161C08ED|nr:MULTISPECIES: DUF4148 domain-containing protein [unclassified Herbaspirillum]MBB3214226.1 hypothetical protein [Herbaspirillum sp. Sphag1AN]MBB3247222.1 hypothetical protein [Herbaspirillum sp. Sphag64]
MNAKQILVSVVLFAAAGAAFAETAYPPETKFVSTKTRAEVIAELKQAQAQGLVTNGDNYPIVQEPRSSLTRAQVMSTLSQPSSNESYHGA